MYTAIVEYDEELDCLVLPISPEILAELKWECGDTLNWIISDSGVITISKI